LATKPRTIILGGRDLDVPGGSSPAPASPAISLASSAAYCGGAVLLTAPTRTSQSGMVLNNAALPGASLTGAPSSRQALSDINAGAFSARPTARPKSLALLVNQGDDETGR
jgi:hypothetical protein